MTATRPDGEIRGLVTATTSGVCATRGADVLELRPLGRRRQLCGDQSAGR